MKTKQILVFLVVILFFSVCKQSFSQDCPLDSINPVIAPSQNGVGGFYKPHRTDISNGNPAPSQATFNIIIVFAQFPDESIQSSDWPIDSIPKYMNSLLAPSKNSSGNYWDRYSSTNEILSDYYQELSGGKFHVTGITRHYIYNDIRSKYTGVAEMNNEIYGKLAADPNIIWTDFDRWTPLGGDGNYEYARDGAVDMVVIVRRTFPGYSGFAGLDGNSYQVDALNNIWIRNGFSAIGSGAVVQGNNTFGPVGFSQMIAVGIHEIGHFLWGYHSSTGLMTSRNGLSIHDLFASPFEKIKLGYLSPTEVSFPSTNITLGDISNRSSNDQLLKVPISSDEYFLIENRRKISGYDKIMLGDTTALDLKKDVGDKGKGVYIYHGKETGYYPQGQDEECADGLWNWTVDGTQTPDWSNSQNIPLIRKDGIPNSGGVNAVNNDNGYWENLTNRDALTAVRYNSSGIIDQVWFGYGKRHSSLGELGTDKLYTNTPGWWTSRECFGDRFDAWNLGYNELFSPYSNPNTKTWNNSESNIFIYYHTLDNGSAKFNIYKATDQNSLDNILMLTPPSKPMILGIAEHFDGTHCHPKIKWRQNTEPDMVRSSNNGETFLTYKQYKIYRTSSANMGIVPADQQFYPENVYTYVATVNADPNTLDAEWVDNSINLYDCSPLGGIPYGTKFPVRYRIQAVDVYNSASVLSDFRQANGVDGSGGVEDAMVDSPSGNLVNNRGENAIPKNFNLYQNYPNPFNPTTNIQYDLPKDNFVSIKVYDLLGKQIAELVNEYKQAGSYLVSFDASKLASGIYFYKIETREFVQTKRMLLVK